MSGGTADAPQLYRVSVSVRVSEQLASLAGQARRRGDGEAFLAALREFHRRLSIYPQFGEPLTDMTEGGGQTYIGIIPPLAMRYGVAEDRRIVLVAARPVLLPMETGAEGV